MNSGVIGAVAWAEGTRPRLGEGGAAQDGQARVESWAAGEVHGAALTRRFRERSAQTL